jgi:hypothetical protein
MTYVLSIAKERNLTLSSVEDLKTSVVEVIDLILKDYELNKNVLTTGDRNQLCKELSEVVGEPEEGYEVESLAELILLRKNVSEELDNLFSGAKEEIAIHHDSDPMWGVTLYLEDSKLVLEAYSDVDSNYLWDALLKNLKHLE